MNTQELKALAISEAKEVKAFDNCLDYSESDLFEFYQGITNEYELGIYAVKNLKHFHEWKHLRFIDYEAIGYSLSKSYDGLFTDFGFIFINCSES